MNEKLLYTRKGLRAHIYYWTETLSDVESIFICAPGMPNYLNKEYFKGLPVSFHKYAFVSLYYYGYWYSEGAFTVQGTAKSISDTISSIRKGSFCDASTNAELPVYKKHLYILGYSFGANPLARSLSTINVSDISGVIFCAPLAIVQSSQFSKIKNSKIETYYDFNRDFLRFLRSGYPKIINGITHKEWDDYFMGKSNESHIQIPDEWTDKIRIYYGKNDTLLPKESTSSFNDLFNSEQIHTIANLGHDKELITRAILDLEN